MDLPKHYRWRPDFPDLAEAVAPTVLRELPAFAGLQSYFHRLEKVLKLGAYRDDEKWTPRIGVYLYGPLAAHLYTGENQTGEIHSTLAYPIEVPEPFEESVPSPSGPLVMRRAPTPAASELRWPLRFARPEIELSLGVESFGVRCHDPIDLAASMCTVFGAQEEASICSLVKAGLITASSFDLAWADSLGDGDPNDRDLKVR